MPKHTTDEAAEDFMPFGAADAEYVGQGDGVDSDDSESGPVSQLEIDAEALGYDGLSIYDVDSVQDMLEQSLKNELRASRAFQKWKASQGSRGAELLRACAEHRQRTSRLYAIITDGIDGAAAD